MIQLKPKPRKRRQNIQKSVEKEIAEGSKNIPTHKLMARRMETMRQTITNNEVVAAERRAILVCSRDARSFEATVFNQEPCRSDYAACLSGAEEIPEPSTQTSDASERKSLLNQDARFFARVETSTLTSLSLVR